MRLQSLLGTVVLAICLNTNSAMSGTETLTLDRADGSTIEYHLDNRSSDSRQDLLLVLQGSDCNSVKTNPAIRDLAGIDTNSVTLTIEKYGLTPALPRGTDDRQDCPADYLSNNTPQLRVMDALTVLAHLRQTASWWMGNLVILGGSSGALVAEQVAALTPETTHVVIFGFGSRWFEDDLIPSIKTSLEQTDLPPAQQNKILESVLAELETAKRSRSTDRYMSGHSHAYWADLASWDQLILLSRLRMPVLALHGGQDQSASPQGASDLITAAKKSGLDVTFKVYENLDHGFRTPDGTSKLSEVVSDIQAWVQTN